MSALTKPDTDLVQYLEQKIRQAVEGGASDGGLWFVEIGIESAKVLAALVRRLEKRCEELEGALRPFAEFGLNLAFFQCHSGICATEDCVRCRKVLAARAALTPSGTDAGNVPKENPGTEGMSEGRSSRPMSPSMPDGGGNGLRCESALGVGAPPATGETAPSIFKKETRATPIGGWPEARPCQGCRSLDEPHDYGDTCTLAEKIDAETEDLLSLPRGKGHQTFPMDAAGELDDWSGTDATPAATEDE